MNDIEGGIKVYRYLTANTATERANLLNRIRTEDDLVPIYGYAVIAYDGSKTLYMKSKDANGITTIADLGEYPRKGDRGLKGDTGERGERGSRGERGFTGGQGAPGASFTNLSTMDATPYEPIFTEQADSVKVDTFIDIHAGQQTKTAQFLFEVPKASAQPKYLHIIRGNIGADSTYFDGVIRIINNSPIPYLVNNWEHQSQATLTASEIAKCISIGGDVESMGTIIYKGAYNVTANGNTVQFLDEAGFHQMTIPWESYENSSIVDTVIQM